MRYAPRDAEQAMRDVVGTTYVLAFWLLALYKNYWWGPPAGGQLGYGGGGGGGGGSPVSMSRTNASDL